MSNSDNRAADAHFADDSKEKRPLTLPSQFAFVCESPDGRLCLFEDAQGHLTAVRTSRLA